MNRSDVIRYVDMTIEEGFSIQRGMNFNIANKEYGIILMSVRKNAPYADRFEDNGTTIIYARCPTELCPGGKQSEGNRSTHDHPVRAPF